jgi:MFS family permease
VSKTIQGSIIWFLITLFVVYAFCLNTAGAVFSEAIKNSLHINNLGVSVATGTFILGFAGMQIPAGYLIDQFNPRWVVSGGIFLLMLGNILISFSNNLLLFALSNLLQGIGASFAFVAAAVLISQWFSAKKFPILFGFTQTFSCVATGLIHYYFTVALNIYTWNDIYRSLALFGFILLILAILLIKTGPNYTREKTLGFKNSLLSVLKNKQILLCSLAAATSFGVLLVYASLWYSNIQIYYKVPTLEAIVISGLIFAGIGIGAPLLAWFSNMARSRTMVIHVTLILGIMALLLGIYLPHYNINSLLIIKTISFFIGFLLSGSMLFYTIVSEIANNATRGVAISVLNTFVFLFNMLMLFIPYLFITSASKQFFTYLWILPFCVLLSLLLVYFVQDSFSEIDKT